MIGLLDLPQICPENALNHNAATLLGDHQSRFQLGACPLSFFCKFDKVRKNVFLPYRHLNVVIKLIINYKKLLSNPASLANPSQMRFFITLFK
jgi:hypothetical protein